MLSKKRKENAVEKILLKATGEIFVGNYRNAHNYFYKTARACGVSTYKEFPFSGKRNANFGGKIGVDHYEEEKRVDPKDRRLKPDFQDED